MENSDSDRNSRLGSIGSYDDSNKKFTPVILVEDLDETVQSIR
jgi:hypothetical protein